jgi:hypothetical protein
MADQADENRLPTGGPETDLAAKLAFRLIHAMRG